MNNLLWIKAPCNNYGNLIIKLQYLNINIRDIKYNNKVIHLLVTDADFQKISKYLISYKFVKDRSMGFNKIKESILGNWILLVSVIMGTIVFSFAHNLILEINVNHESKEIRELIQDELDSYGIKVLTLKKDYQRMDKIKKEILDKYPRKLDWLEFSLDGMILNVNVEERIITDISKDDKKCNIVAKKSGVINDILVYQGESLVMINDYVREGDTLITGIIKYNDEDKRMICASGEVYATTWYTVSVSVPFEYNEYEYTGRSKYNFVWEHEGVKKNILRDRFDSYESNYQTILDIFDFKLYLDKEKETKKITKKYEPDQALEVGVNKAVDSVRVKMGEFDSIIDKKVLKKSINDSTMDIEVFIVLKELISMEEKIELENIKEGID